MTASTMKSIPESAALAITCFQCGEAAPAAHRFCGKCGQLLWEPCLECEEKNPVDERFCGKCGTDLDERLQTTLQALTEALQKADQEADQGRFLDAVEMLQNLEFADHSQLSELTTEIRERIKTYPQRREQAIADSESVVTDAQQMIANGRYLAAHERLSKIPTAFRNQELTDLLNEVTSKVTEAQQLQKQVKQALQEKKHEGLLPQVKRLAELRGDDASVQKLLTQLEKQFEKREQLESSKLLKLAQVALQKCDYKQAAVALRKMRSPAGENEKQAKAVQHVKECVWLAEQMRSEPLVSPTLRAVADRLAKLQPHDRQHAKIAQQLHARWLKAVREKSSGAVPWKKSPQCSELGPPINLLPLPAELVGLQKTETASSQPLIVAFGLALQGLGKCRISLELSPQTKQRLWSKIVSRRKSKQTAQSAWGVDLGSKSLKAVQLMVDNSGENLRVTNSVVLPLSSEHGEEAAAQTTVCQKFFQQHDMQHQTVVINLPGTQTLGRFFDLPAPKPEKFFDAVAYEMRARIPLEPEKSVFDYHWSELPATEQGGAPQRRVVLVAANKEHVLERLSLFENAGAKQLLVQSDGVALTNAYAHCVTPEHENTTVALLEIGARSSNFVAISDSSFWFRGIFQGTDAFDKVIAKHLRKKLGDAELLRRKPEKAAAMHEIDDLLQPEFAILAAELRRTLDRYCNETGQNITQLLLCGAGSNQFGLLRHLQTPI